MVVTNVQPLCYRDMHGQGKLRSQYLINIVHKHSFRICKWYTTPQLLGLAVIAMIINLPKASINCTEPTMRTCINEKGTLWNYNSSIQSPQAKLHTIIHVGRVIHSQFASKLSSLRLYRACLSTGVYAITCICTFN